MKKVLLGKVFVVLSYIFMLVIFLLVWNEYDPFLNLSLQPCTNSKRKNKLPNILRTKFKQKISDTVCTKAPLCKGSCREATEGLLQRKCSKVGNLPGSRNRALQSLRPVGTSLCTREALVCANSKLDKIIGSLQFLQKNKKGFQLSQLICSPFSSVTFPIERKGYSGNLKKPRGMDHYFPHGRIWKLDWSCNRCVLYRQL